VLLDQDHEAHVLVKRVHLHRERLPLRPFTVGANGPGTQDATRHPLRPCGHSQTGDTRDGEVPIPLGPAVGIGAALPVGDFAARGHDDLHLGVLDGIVAVGRIRIEVQGTIAIVLEDGDAERPAPVGLCVVCHLEFIRSPGMDGAGGVGRGDRQSERQQACSEQADDEHELERAELTVQHGDNPPWVSSDNQTFVCTFLPVQ